MLKKNNFFILYIGQNSLNQSLNNHEEKYACNYYFILQMHAFKIYMN